VSGTSNLNSVGNVTITGGSNGQVLTTNGSGTLSWGNAGNATAIVNGNSNVVVAANSNVTVGVAGNASIMTITGTGANVAGTLNVTGNANVGNIGATNFVGNGAALSGVAVRTTGTWTVATGTNTYSITVPANGAYQLWFIGSIPNGIISYQATVIVTNTNVPVLGTQRAWNYTGGGSPLILTTMPPQIVGVDGTISTTVVVTTTANRFDFVINNSSGSSQTVSWGYVTL
jgi:hypothetical protein